MCRRARTASDDTITSDTVLDDDDPRRTASPTTVSTRRNSPTRYQECSSLADVGRSVALPAGLHRFRSRCPTTTCRSSCGILECGVGDVTLGVVSEYDLTDEEYTAILVKANDLLHRPDRPGRGRGLRGARRVSAPGMRRGSQPVELRGARQPGALRPLARLHLRRVAHPIPEIVAPRRAYRYELHQFREVVGGWRGGAVRRLGRR